MSDGHRPVAVDTSGASAMKLSGCYCEFLVRPFGMNGMVLLKTGFIAAVGVGLLLSKLWAGEERERLKGRGKLASVDPVARSLSVQVDAGRIEKFNWDDSTRFFNIDGPISPEQLQIGQTVSIASARSKTPMVSRIEVEPEYEVGQG